LKNKLIELTGVEFPLFAFSHCRDVVAAVSRAGGFGVLGGSSFSPERLEEELTWIDAHCGGKPYGVDLVVPEHQAIGPQADFDAVIRQIPQAHKEFAAALVGKYGIEMKAQDTVRNDGALHTSYETGEALLEVAFRHPIRLIANALGLAPPAMIARARAAGVPVAALVGARDHALRQVKAGVDIVVAQGTEAGGHCGEVSTQVLVTEVVRALKAGGHDIPVLAAGGIMTGGQMAGLMAMGAQGAWTGTIWLATAEAETSEAIREKMVAAGSRDTTRSKFRTGKPCRQLKSAWHEEWESAASPGPLPFPHMTLLSQPVFEKIDRAVLAGNKEARKLVSYFVGQGVGLVESVVSAATVVQNFKEEFADAVSGLLEQTGL
jgi:NAD(P)H-dependent flavin oxidoreductase YrpB (nitropropane dioxygenase family)